MVHHDDLQYILYMSFKFPFFKVGDSENVMVDKLTSMWANFAKTGEPIPRKNKLFKNVHWTTLTSTNRAYLEIGEKFKMKNNMNADRYNLWEKLFPLKPLP